jgi:hypothetical protein
MQRHQSHRDDEPFDLFTKLDPENPLHVWNDAANDTTEGRQRLLIDGPYVKRAYDFQGNLRRFFKPNPYKKMPLEALSDIKPSSFEGKHPDDFLFYNKALNKNIDALSEEDLAAFYHGHKQKVQAAQEAVDQEAAEQAAAEEARVQALLQEHITKSNKATHNVGTDVMLGTGGLGAGLYGGKKVYDTLREKGAAAPPTPTEAALFLKDAIKKLTLFHPEKLTSPRDLDSLGAHVREYVAALPPEVKAQINHLHGDFEAGHATAHDILKGNIPAPPIKAAPPQPQQPKQHNDASSSSTSSDAAPSKSKWPLYTVLGVGGAGLLGGAGAVGHHLYKEREAENMLNKESEEQPLSEEQIQTLRLMSLTPEQRAMYMQVNPAGVPKMATNMTPEHLKSLRDVDKKQDKTKYLPKKVRGIREESKEAGVRDFVSRHLGRKSEEFIQGRKALDVAAKAKNEEDLLAAYAKKRGLHVDEKGVIGNPPAPKEPGFLQRNKWPLGMAAAGAGGLYMLNQQDKMSSYDETLCRLGLAKLAAKMPPPIPLKAKGPAASKGKPFFTPSQSTAAKKMSGPAPAKAPWEEAQDVKLSFDRGYVDALASLKLAGAMAQMLKKAPIHSGAAPKAYAEGFGVRAAKPVQGPGAVDKVKGAVSGAADKAKSTWDKMPTWGKGMAAGGAGLGLLGAGAGVGSAMSSPAPVIVNH